MLRIRADETKIEKKTSQVLVIGYFEDEEYSQLFHSLNKEIVKAGRQFLDKYSSKFGCMSELNTLSKMPAQNILFVGLAKKTDFNAEKARIISGKIVQYLKEFDIEEFSIVPFDLSDEIIEAITEGIILSSYSFDKYKTKSEKNHLQTVAILCNSKSKHFQTIIDRASIISETVNFARDVSNLPPNECTPEYLAKIATNINKKAIKTKIIDLKKMKLLGLNGITSVGRGSKNQPKLIIMEYHGNKNNENPILLVGKAVTFDSGGISIKPSERMEEMKFDKCGGVNIIAIMKALSILKPNIYVIGIVPSVENMPSDSSYKPSDIIEMHNHKKVEVLNTDAEGRLILADALSYGISTYKPKLAIDMATLTGACVIALGSIVAGIIGTNSELIKKIIDHSNNTDEKLWELPLFEEFHEQIKSNSADIKNIGGRSGGAITAAAFLSNFVGDVPWAHIDIAGTAWNQEGTLSKSYNPKGATGFGIRTIIKFLLVNPK